MLRRVRSSPCLEGMVRGEEEHAMTPEQKEELLACESQEWLCGDGVDHWSLYTQAMGSRYWEVFHDDADVEQWRCVDGNRLMRRLSYTVKTHVPIGPPTSRIVEVQEVVHRPGQLFEKWVVVMPQASWGVRFHIHMHVVAHIQEDESICIRQRIRPVVLHQRFWGLRKIVERESRKQCRDGLDNWCKWISSEVDDDALSPA